MLVPKLPSFLKVPKYKTFNIEPRYYNPVKEEREKRIARIKADLERENPGKVAEGHEHIRIRGFYSQRKSKSHMISQRQSSARVLLIFIALVLIVYIIFS
ncbi:MAG: hypothetical protein ACR2GN_02865 [Bacteroidia bacterium]